MTMRLQFSLRVFLLFITVAALLSWGLAKYLRKDEQAAIAELTNRGWQVTVDPDGAVHLDGEYRTDAGMEEIRALNTISNLRTLTLCRDAGVHYLLDGLEPNTSLLSVHLSDGEVYDDDLKYLAKWPQLEQVELYRTEVTSNGLKSIPTEHLRRVDIAYCGNLTGDLPHWRNLEDLTVIFTPLHDNVLESLHTCRRLKTLRLVGTEVTGSGFSATDAYALESLDLRQSNIDEEGLNRLAVTPSRETLKTLNLSRNTQHVRWSVLPELSSEMLLRIASWPKLEELRIDGFQFTGNSPVEPSPGPLRLRRLEIKNCDVPPSVLRSLLHPQLEQLRVQWVKSFSVEKQLPRCVSLREVSINGEPIRIKDIEAFVRLPNLKTLRCIVENTPLESIQELSKQRPNLTIHVHSDYPTEPAPPMNTAPHAIPFSGVFAASSFQYPLDTASDWDSAKEEWGLRSGLVTYSYTIKNGQRK